MNNIPKFKQKLKTGISKDSFAAFAIEAFHIQYHENCVYQSFVDFLGLKPEFVKQVEQIPFIPISLFKSRQIITGEGREEVIFESSTTTSQTPSKHFILDREFYFENAREGFEKAFGSLSNYHFFFLLPGYLDRPNSSLVSMAKFFFENSDKTHGGFFLRDYDKLSEGLEKVRNSPKKVILWGVSFALLDFLPPFNFEELGFTVLETGGMKGKGPELTKAQLHKRIKSIYGVEKVFSEYGMTELLSQFYTSGGEVFHQSDTARVYLREINDPMFINANRSFGGLNVIDLANIDSCCFIATDDLGKIHKDGSFEVIGRLDNSDTRGCNLLFN